MNVRHAPATRRQSAWVRDITSRAYENACNALETRPDFREIEGLWAAIDERFKFMRYEHDPEYDDNQLYEMDMTELAGEAGCDDTACLSHLYTLVGAGMLAGVTVYQEYNSVSVVVAPNHIKPKA